MKKFLFSSKSLRRISLNQFSSIFSSPVSSFPHYGMTFPHFYQKRHFSNTFWLFEENEPEIISQENVEEEKSTEKKKKGSKFVAMVLAFSLIAIASFALMKREELREMITKRRRKETKNDVENVQKKEKHVKLVINGEEIEISEELEKRIEDICRKSKKSKKSLEEFLIQTFKSNEKMQEEIEEYINGMEVSHITEIENSLKDQKNDLEMQYAEENMERIEKLRKLCIRVSAIENIYASKARYVRNSKKFQDIAMLVFTINRIIQTPHVPIEKEVEVLKNVSKGDDLLEEILEHVPEQVLKHGVDDDEELRQELVRMRKKIIQYSFVTKDQTSLHKIYSRFASNFMFTDSSEINHIIDQALIKFDKGMLNEAVMELQKIQQGEAPDILDPWMKKVQSRLSIFETMKIIQSHLVNLSHEIN